MHALRRLILKRRQLALLAIALVLAMKALVPAGYMVSASSKIFTITICSESTGEKLKTQVQIPMKAGHGGDAAAKADQQPCPYSSLSLAALGGADAPLLALAIAFILALGFLPAPPLPLRQAHYLLPPLRGPPATA